jgi:hypothetical protein
MLPMQPRSSTSNVVAHPQTPHHTRRRSTHGILHPVFLAHRKYPRPDMSPKNEIFMIQSTLCTRLVGMCPGKQCPKQRSDLPVSAHDTLHARPGLCLQKGSSLSWKSRHPRSLPAQDCHLLYSCHSNLTHNKMRPALAQLLQPAQVSWHYRLMYNSSVHNRRLLTFAQFPGLEGQPWHSGC